MNKSAIQRFAIQARKDLIDGVSQRAYQYGITKDGYGERNAVTVGGRALTSDEQRQRKELVDQISSKGYTQVMEEVAYTWFNRFIALRFMEVNNYLPSHIRVFSDSTGAFKPEILNDVLHLDLPGLKLDKVAEYIENNQTEDLYRYLLLTQCNALNEALPQMFERMGGFTELLLPNNILKQDSVLGRMVTEIPEEDWTDQIQIIGWLYQYYNTELKDDTFALLKKNVKITKERLPSATQLFTPDWIVRYMVENSLGRLWIEDHPNAELKAEWEYYLDEAEQEADVQAQLDTIRAEYSTLKPQEIKVIDPCMGSGHILVYAFDVLVQIYKSYGISERDAARSILENNLYGLDIDDRAAQLAYFAVMMKARQYDRRIFSRGIQPHVLSIVESNGLDGSTIDYFTDNKPQLKRDFRKLVDELRDAKEYGSMLNVSQVDFAALYARIDEVRDDISIFREIVLNSILPLIQVAETLAQRYDVVVTNPPYMAISNAAAKVYDYAKTNYPDSKSDLFAVFIDKCNRMIKNNGIQAMITMQSWMFLSSYETMRGKMLSSSTILSLLHLGIKAFEEIGNDIVQTASFVIRKNRVKNFKGAYFRLLTHDRAEKVSNYLHNIGRYDIPQYKFSEIPGAPIAYWVGESTFEAFLNLPQLGSVSEPKQGIATADNNRFLRLWHEVDITKIGFGIGCGNDALKSGMTWFPYQKGGDFRKWYGNNNYVVLWKDDGYEIKHFKAAAVRNPDYQLREGLTWTWITTGYFGARFSPRGSVFDVAGSTLFADNHLYDILAFMCSCVADYLVKIINPTINFSNGVISKLPVQLRLPERVCEIAKQNVAISKEDWDSFEASWNFVRHPLVPSAKYMAEQRESQFRSSRLEKAGRISWWFDNWKQECEARFSQLKSNEEELNRTFIEVYEMQGELSPDVEAKDVTVHLADLKTDIKSLISYAVGCMFGRYSLDADGLVYAGGEWIPSKYSTIIPDKDNIIPICDDEYFDDDITGRFVKWVEAVYGAETLEENLKFVAEALGGKGTAREVIRNYFMNDFYSDHCVTYSVTGSGKRPIYWLFDSGKKNGFKALVYMHRYQSDLLARMRTDYVHEQQERYRTQLSHLAEAVDRASASERVKLNKQIKKIQEQALEIQKYEEKIHHLADQNISIDLDDGVKHNYELFAGVLAKLK